MFLNFVKLLRFVLLIIVLMPFTAMAASQVDFGIICSVHKEAKPIQKAMHNVQEKIIRHIPYTLGNIGAKKVVLVTSGVSDIDTAVVATRLIDDFNPRYVLFVGSAGLVNPKLNIGDVILSRQVYFLDYGNPTTKYPSLVHFEPSPIRGLNEPIYFYGTPQLLKFLPQIKAKLHLQAHNAQGKFRHARIIAGKMATSGHFPNDQHDLIRLKRNKVDLVASEGAAVMKVCWLFQKSCLGIRSASNAIVIDGNNSFLQWNKKNETLAEYNAGQVTVALIKLQ